MALGSFLLGGAVGIGGFVAGQQTNETDPAPAEIVTAAAPVEATPERSTGTTPEPEAPAIDLGSTVEPAALVAEAVGPSVVQVETNIGQGSGVVYADGLILTNHHVIEDAGRVQVRADDGRVFTVEVLGSDPRNDIAVLSAPEADLPIAAIGSSAELQVGQLTVAIGSPFQLSQTVTSGIVSSLNRPVPNAANSVSAMIQTDAPINPGNSGGALANRSGEVVGINASIRTDGTSNTNVGIGFAIPIDTAIEVADRIVAGDPLAPGVLGVNGGGVDDGGLGVPLAEVFDGSAAEEAGLLPGDRVLTIDGAPVTDIQEVVGLVQSSFAGDTIELQILRNGENLTIEATLD